MATTHYVKDPGPRREIDTQFATLFDWDYDGGREKLLRLYQQGKQRQWDGEVRLDWSLPVDPESPENMPDEYLPIYGSPWWDKMSDRDRRQVRHHMGAWMSSQFLHGEQGALICASKIVASVPDADSKFYAATQVMDEARHMEVFDRYLRTKVELAYPLNKDLGQLLDQVVSDREWDMTYLGMQIMIEGLALAAFGMMRQYSNEPLFASLNAYVMQDEARHVAFGVHALDGFYPQLTEGERAIREEFVVEASYLMRDRLLAPEVWEHLGLPPSVLEWVSECESMQLFRSMLFTRIVPNIERLGLLGPKVKKCFTDIGVIGFTGVDVEDGFREDDAVAQALDSLVAEGRTMEEALRTVREADVMETIAKGTDDR